MTRSSHSGALSRRGVLKGAAVGAAAVGAGGARTAYAADGPGGSVGPLDPAGTRPVSTTARMGGNAITMSVVDGALRWSARRDGKTVIDTSALGIRLADGTALGTEVTVTDQEFRTRRTTWSPLYGRNATVTDHYQEQRWTLRDTASGIRFGVRIRAYKTGVALRYVLLEGAADGATGDGSGDGTVTIADELTTFVFPAGTTVYSARDEDAYNPVAPDAIPVSGTSTTDQGPLTDPSPPA